VAWGLKPQDVEIPLLAFAELVRSALPMVESCAVPTL
jgi:hypothetical protein